MRPIHPFDISILRIPRFHWNGGVCHKEFEKGNEEHKVTMSR